LVALVQSGLQLTNLVGLHFESLLGLDAAQKWAQRRRNSPRNTASAAAPEPLFVTREASFGAGVVSNGSQYTPVYNRRDGPRLQAEAPKVPQMIP
jgi:hypothetical protein